MASITFFTIVFFSVCNKGRNSSPKNENLIRNKKSYTIESYTISCEAKSGVHKIVCPFTNWLCSRRYCVYTLKHCPRITEDQKSFFFSFHNSGEE